MAATKLPRGVSIRDLEPHRDDRGTFTELWRAEWAMTHPVQWNAVRSAARVLRGVHVHVRHHDYLTLAAGRATIGLCDLRRESDWYRRSTLIELDAECPRALVIPPGVAHGFFFHEPSVHCYAVSATFDPRDELGCRFDDPGLGIAWPAGDPHLSTRDEALPPLEVLLEQLEPHQWVLGGAGSGAGADLEVVGSATESEPAAPRRST